MNIPTQQDHMDDYIAMKGTDEAKKEQPKLIEKLVDKVESFLTQTADSDKNSKKKTQKKAAEPKKQNHTQQPSDTPEEAQNSGSLGANNEYILPEGTTIKLPDGKEFVTHTKSKIVKFEPQEQSN